MLKKPNRKAQTKKWRQENKEKSSGYTKKYTDKKGGSLYHEEKWLKRKYDITPEQKYSLLADQDEKCAICKTDTLPEKKGWCVDHDHNTKKVRGVLCTNCNSGLGHFKDNIQTLLNAIDYLKGFIEC